MFVVEIFTPEKRFFKGEVDHLIAPGKKGWFGILANHAPFLSSLTPGNIRLDLPDNSHKTLRIPGGFLEVDNNHVIILADSVEPVENAAAAPHPEALHK